MIKFSEWERNNFKKFSSEPGITIIFSSREIYFSQGLLKTMRLESQNAPKTLEQWYELCNPSDHMKIAEFEKIVYKSDGIFLSLPRALYCGDGVYRNFRLDAFIQRDADGRPLKLIGNEISSLDAWLSNAEDGDRIELNDGTKILEALSLNGTMIINDVTRLEDLERENLILRHEISRRIFSPFPNSIKSLINSGREDFIYEVLSENLDGALNIFPRNSKLNSLKNSLNEPRLNVAVMGLSGSGKTTFINALTHCGVINGNINLIDTVGWDSLNGNDGLKNIMPGLDFVFYVAPVRSRLKGADYELLEELKANGSKIIFVLSKIDLETTDTEAGKIIKTPGEKISDDIEALKIYPEISVIPVSAKNALEYFHDRNSDEWKNSNIESVIDVIKTLGENSRGLTLIMRAERALKVIESEGNGKADLIIKNLGNLINDNAELKELKIPENKFNLNFNHARQNDHILSSLIISMREHGFKGRFFSLAAFNGNRRAVLFSAERNMSMKLFARLSHNIALEKLSGEIKNSWLCTHEMPFECSKISSAALASDEKILIAPPDYLLKKEDFDSKFKKLLRDYTPVVSVDLARLESGLSDLIHAPYINMLTKSKWILAFPNATLLKDDSVSIDEMKDGIKNFCKSKGLKAPEFFIYENYTIEETRL